MRRFTRRQTLAALVGTAGLARVIGSRTFRARPAEPLPATRREAPPPAPDASVHEFVGLAPGAPIGPATLVGYHGVHLGAIPFVLRVGEDRFQVDVLARDASAPAVAETQTLALYLSNDGHGPAGSRASDEHRA